MKSAIDRKAPGTAANGYDPPSDERAIHQTYSIGTLLFVK
jgi:hypothetical protein